MPAFQIILPFSHTEADLQRAVEQMHGSAVPYRILKRSIDARQREIKVQYSLTTDLDDPLEEIRQLIESQSAKAQRAFASGSRPVPVIVGTGPAGIFCALWLHLHGFNPIVLEQGPPMEQRIRDMARFMKRGELNPYSNICFGAGGAGTYSDGKLITRIRSPYIGFIMEQFVAYGAPEDIRYVYNPHLGSNKIRQCITRMLADMQTHGVEIRYNTRFTGFSTGDSGAVETVETSAGTIDAPGALFLATGHSSRETYELLRRMGIPMETKEYAVGVRVEHSAHTINRIQYGSEYSERYPGIETAQYKLAQTWQYGRLSSEGATNRAVYSFCMCPGGYVLNASTGAEGVVTNGMSNYLKSGRFSNSAMVVNVNLADLDKAGYSGVDAGLEFQKELEAKFRASVNAPGMSNVIPAQRLTDFLDGRASQTLGESSCLNPIASAPMHTMFPAFVYDALQRGFGIFDTKMRGFARSSEAQVFGAETRTSSPYRIVRDQETLVSPACSNFYPAGEGAGYAGGITSAAIDGIRCAQQWVEKVVG